jgi:hypothetical protein
MAKVIGHRFSVCWANPYTEPPEGYDRYPLTVETRKSHPTPPEITAKIEELGRLHGKTETFAGKTIRINPWGLGCGAETVPTRVVPLKSKQRQRRKNLWKRCAKKHGIFVHEAEAEYRAKIETDRAHYGISELTKEIPCPPK